MVTLRRGPRLQRKCKISANDPDLLHEAKTVKKPNHSKKKGPSKTTNAFSPRQEVSDKVRSPEGYEQFSIEQEDAKLLSRRSTRSRLSGLPDKNDSSVIMVGILSTDKYGITNKDQKVTVSNSYHKSKMTNSKLDLNERNEKTVSKEDMSFNNSTTSPNMDSSPRKLSQMIDISSSKPGLKRKHHVSTEVISSVKNEERSHSVCSLILNKQRKRRLNKSNIDDQSGEEDKKSGNFPSFSGISPIIPSKYEVKKLEHLEKSMNLFQCPVSPISNSASHKSIDYSHLALKTDVKSLPKRPKTKPTKGAKNHPIKSSVVCRKEDIMKENLSLLRTPVKQVFQSSTRNKIETTIMGDDGLDCDAEVAEDLGYTLYPLSKEVEPSTKQISISMKHNKTVDKDPPMEYENWLQSHQSDFDKFKDMELCIE